MSRTEVLASETRPFGIKVIIVEPGAFRTDWQCSSMRRYPVGPDYEATVGQMNAYRAAHDGTQPGDPARAAQVILRVLAEDEPPRGLLLGADAVTSALAAEANRTAETQKWAPLSRAADFPAREFAGRESASGG